MTEDNTEIHYVIGQKIIKEFPEECGCNQLQLFLANDVDSIIINYDNTNRAYSEDLISRPSQFSFKSRVSESYTFLGDHNVSNFNSFELEGLVFQEGLVLEQTTSSALEGGTFARIIFAKKHGIIQMEKVNGEILTAADLTEQVDYELGSFQRESWACE